MSKQQMQLPPEDQPQPTLRTLERCRELFSKLEENDMEDAKNVSSNAIALPLLDIPFDMVW